MSTRDEGSELLPSSDPSGELDVPRADLASALQIVAGATAKSATRASIRFEDGWLYIESGHTSASAPACGVWPLTIVVGMSWVRRLAKSLPTGDPIRLRVTDGRLYANRFSEPCAWTATGRPVNPELPDIDEKHLILEASRILQPLRVSQEDIQTLVRTARERGAISWRIEERKMIALIAKAWALLAPLGVETADLRRVADDAVRNAWREPK